MTNVHRSLALKKPCANCPFRRDDAAIELRPGRREGIIRDLLNDNHGAFHCHKTVYRKGANNHDEEGNYTPKDVAICPGAVAVARKVGNKEPQAVQVAMRLGLIPFDHYDDALPLTLDPEDLDMAAVEE